MELVTKALASLEVPESIDALKIPIAANADTGALISRILNWVGIIAGILLFAYILYGGFLYLTAAGNEEQLKKGGQAIVNALIGIVILAIAYNLARLAIEIVSTGGGGGGGGI